MSREAYWIWLQKGVGIGNNTARVLCEIPDIEFFYNNGPDYWAATELFSPKQLDRLSAYDINKAEEVLKLCKERNWSVITPDSELFPPQLLRIMDCPLVLYTDGDINIFDDRLAMAFVGTRSASTNGIDITARLSAALAKANIVIVSGGAMGIDSAAHKGALAVNGKTALVLGCGLACDYLKTNRKLRTEIAEKGVIITEYPPDSPARPENFLVRNRIISALSMGITVMEPGEKSGSLNTAAHAFRQGRKVFVVPGNILDSNQTGLKKLIDSGAIMAFSPTDFVAPFLEEYEDVIDIENLSNNILKPVLDPLDVPSKLNRTSHISSTSAQYAVAEEVADTTNKIDTSQLDENEVKVVEALKDGIKATDSLIEITGFILPQLSPLLLRLQLLGIISKTTDNKFKLK